MTNKTEISAKLAHKLFQYDDGKLYWKVLRQGINPKDEAGSLYKTGYRYICISGKAYLTHRLVFLMFHGYLPEFLDHIDGNPLNNRIDNLREATRSQNQHNLKMRSDNKSGVKGVSWDKVNQKWRARVMLNNVYLDIGRFDDIDMAAAAIHQKRIELHGEFARHC